VFKIKEQRRIPLYVLNNYIKFERKLYQIAGISLGRPLRVKSAIYFLVISAILAVLYFAPITGAVISKMPFGVLILIPFGLAWLLSDVGTEDRSPVAFFRSFIAHNIRKIKGYSIYRGRKVPRAKVYSFNSHINYIQTDSSKVALEIKKFNEKRKKELEKQQETLSYIERMRNISGQNKVSVATSVMNNNYVEDEKNVAETIQSEDEKELSFDDFGKNLLSIQYEENNPDSVKEVQKVNQEAIIPIVEEEIETQQVNDLEEELNTSEVLNLARIHNSKDKEPLGESGSKRKEKGTADKRKSLPVIIAAGVALSLAATLFLLIVTNTIDVHEISPFNSADQVVADKGNEDLVDEDDVNDHEENLMNGLRSASIQNYDEAVEYFDNVDFQILDQDDKEIVLLSYLFTNQAEKTLKLDPKFDEVVISYYHAKENLEPLRELISYSKDIEFEIAVYDEDYQKVIDMKDKVTLNDESEEYIVDAYLELNQIDEALFFADAVEDNNNLIMKIDNFKEDKDAKKRKRK